jgi:hypothetical protein
MFHVGAVEIAIVSAHFLIFAVIWACKNMHVILFTILTVNTAVSLNSQTINTYLRANVSQYYFDRQGTFLAFSLLIPIMLQCLLIAALLVYQASQLLIKVKSREFQRGKKKAE